MKTYFIAGAIALLTLSGCSAEGVYNSRQSSEQTECRKQPPPADQECLQRTKKTYDEYMREREEVLKD